MVPSDAAWTSLPLVLEHLGMGKISGSIEQEASGLGKTPLKREQLSWASKDGQKRKGHLEAKETA